MKKIAILMTSYNGERFLENQIKSINNQTYKNWTLFIQDDGSSDDTKDILMKYSNSDSRIIYLKNESKYHGAFPNFFTLIKKVRSYNDFEYFCFCDQDDIWLPNKLEVLYRIMAEMENEKGKELPIMLYSDMFLIDSKGNRNEKTINEYSSIKLKNRYDLFFSPTYVWGCSTFFNKALFNLAPDFSLDSKVARMMSHDGFYSKLADMYGEITFIETPLVDYRRHEENVSSLPSRGFSFNLAMKGISDLARRHAYQYSQILFLLNLTKQISINPILDLIGLKEALENGGIKSFLFLLRNRVTNKSFSKTVALYFVLLSKSYKKYLVRD